MTDFPPSPAGRLFLVAAGPTDATRQARFPADEPLLRPDLVPALRADHWRSGPELRCRQTAEALGGPADVDPRLADLHPGNWAGLGLTDIGAADPELLMAWLSDPQTRPPGGETLVELQARVADLLTAEPPAGRACWVTSTWVVKAALVQLLAAPASKIFAIEVAPLDVLELTRRGPTWVLRGLRPLG